MPGSSVLLASFFLWKFHPGREYLAVFAIIPFPPMHPGASPHLPCTPWPAVAIFGLCALVTIPVRAADLSEADQMKRDADRWIELEQRAADERNDWRTQREVLAASVEALKTGQTNLRAKVESNNLAADLFRSRVEKLRTELTAHESGHAALNTGCEALEQRLQALWARLPEPLQETIKPQLDKLEAPPGATPLPASERAQLLISALTAVDQFNNSLTVTHQLRPDGAGETLDVKVLYWGLAMGFGIDATGQHAWVLTPGAAGWTWTDATGQVDEIRTLVEIQEKQQNPELVMLQVGSEGGAQ